MPADYHFLTEADKVKLQGLFEDVEKLRKNYTAVSEALTTSQSPEVYVVKGAVPAGSGTTPGTADLPVYRVTSGTLTAVVLPNTQSKKVTVHNTSVALPDAYHIAIRTKYGKWFISSSTNVPGSRIRYLTTADMFEREVAAVVKWASAGASVQVDDVVTIHDPRNGWPEMQAGATGMAFWQELIPEDTGAGTPEIPAHWETEPASTPINMVLAYIEDCVHQDNVINAGTAHVHCTDELVPVGEGQADDFILSDANCRDIPSEWSKVSGTGSNFKYTFPFDNPQEIDLIPKVTTGSGSGQTTTYKPFLLKRVTKARSSDNENIITPKEGRAAATPYWILMPIGQGQQFARVVYGTVSAEIDGTPTVNPLSLEFDDGADPTVCGTPEFIFKTVPKCKLEDEPFVGEYWPRLKKYVITVTNSALLGTIKEYTYNPDLQIVTEYGGKKLCVKKFKIKTFCIPEQPTDKSCIPIKPC